MHLSRFGGVNSHCMASSRDTSNSENTHRGSGRKANAFTALQNHESLREGGQKRGKMRARGGKRGEEDWNQFSHIRTISLLRGGWHIEGCIFGIKAFRHLRRTEYVQFFWWGWWNGRILMYFVINKSGIWGI